MDSLIDKLSTLGSILLLVGCLFLFLKTPSQRIEIKELSLSTDTIVVPKSRWLYTADSMNKDIRISVYEDLTPAPYIEEVLYAPEDFTDLKLKDGKNIVHLQELGSHPNRFKRITVIKMPIKK